MQTLLNERTWRFQKLILLILFIFSPIMLVVLLYLRGLESLSSQVLFSVAVNLLGLLICGLLFISCVKDQKDRSLRTACFAHLIGLTALQMFLSSASYMTPVHGIWVTVIMLEETVLNVGGLLLTLVFFAYIKELAKAWDSVLEWIRKTVTAVAVLLILLSIGNLVGHYLFYMDNGVFVQTEYYPLITLFPLIANIMYVLFSSRMALEPAEKRALLTFIFLPTVGLLIYYFTGVVAVYAAVLCSLIFIYGIVFKTREEELIRSNLEIAQKENELLRVKNDQVRVETELNTAAEIQSRLLPKTFPFFPMFESFDLYATMQPAKEVGGDFYDFFQIDEDHIGLVIADVSGKGIPAALYMMVAKTMIKNVAMQGKTPAEVLETVNHQLCDGGTDLEMFVTVWYGIYEVSSGRLIAANGGHEYPVVKQPNGSFELLKDKHSLVLGGMDGIRYQIMS